MRDIGYEQRGFHWEKASIKVYLHGQSVDIAQGVVSTGNKGAGDHRYACRETPELMPAPTYFAHRILKVMSGCHDWFGKVGIWQVKPNGKFVIGGPDGDCGLIGRKIIVDT